VARSSDEGFPHGPAQLAANRDVLEVGIGGREPAGARHRLVEAGVDTTVSLHLTRQGIDIRGLELRLLTELQDERRQAVPFGGELGQDLGVGRRRLGLDGTTKDRQPATREQHLGELLGRVDVERPTRLGMDLALEVGEGGFESSRKVR